MSDDLNLNDLEKLFTGKIADLEKLEKETVDPDAGKLKELCTLGKDIFSTASGRRFLEILQGYLMQPVSPAHYSERASCIREGNNEIIRQFLRIQNLKL